MKAFFICYRREDTAGYASWLSDCLRREFGAESVFIDVDIPGGSEFPDAIARAVCACDIVLALIGPSWLTASVEGQRRLDDPKDFLRLELVSALAGGRHVIPVLVDRAALPKPEDLPEALRPLVLRQAAEITGANWHTDLERLLAAIERLSGPARRTAQRRRWLRTAAAMLLLLVSSGVVALSIRLRRSHAANSPTPTLSREPLARLDPLLPAPPSERERTPAQPSALARQVNASRPALNRATAGVPSASTGLTPSRLRPARVTSLVTNNLYAVDQLRAVADALDARVETCFQDVGSSQTYVLFDISLSGQGQVLQVKPRAEANPGVDGCVATLVQTRNFGPTLTQRAGRVSVGWSRAPGFSGFTTDF